MKNGGMSGLLTTTLFWLIIILVYYFIATFISIDEVCPDLGDGVSGVGKDTKDNAHSHDDQANFRDRKAHV